MNPALLLLLIFEGDGEIVIVTPGLEWTASGRSHFTIAPNSTHWTCQARTHWTIPAEDT